VQRLARRVELLQGDVAHRRDQVEAVVVVTRARELDLVDREHAVPLAGVAVDRQQLAGDRLVAGLEREHVLERLQPALGRGQAVARERGDPAVQREAVVRVRERGGGVVEHRQDVGEAGLRLEQRDEVVPAAGADVGGAQGRVGALVAGLAAGDLGPHADRLVGLLELVLVDIGEARQQQRGVLVVAGLADLAAQDLGDLAPLLVALVDLQQRLQGDVDVAVLVEDLAPGADRLVLVAEALLGEAGELDADVQRLLALGLRELGAAQVDQRAPVLARLVDAGQHPARLPVAGGERHRVGEQFHRLARVGELVGPDAGDAAQHVDLARDVLLVARGVEQAPVHGEQVVPAVGVAVGVGERLDRRGVARVDVEDLLQHAQRHRVEAELVAVQLRDLEQAGDALLFGLRAVGDAVVLLLEQLDERGPLLALAVQALERLGRARVVAVLAQHRAPDLDRAVEADELLLGEVGHLLREREARLGVVLLERAAGLDQHLHQLAGVAVGGEHLAVEGEDLGVGGVVAADAAEIGLGLGRGARAAGRAAELPDDHAGEQRDVVAGALPRGALRSDLRGVDGLLVRRAVEDHPADDLGGRVTGAWILLGLGAGGHQIDGRQRRLERRPARGVGRRGEVLEEDGAEFGHTGLGERPGRGPRPPGFRRR
jgi:hypothetical protein